MHCLHLNHKIQRSWFKGKYFVEYRKIFLLNSLSQSDYLYAQYTRRGGGEVAGWTAERETFIVTWYFIWPQNHIDYSDLSDQIVSQSNVK